MTHSSATPDDLQGALTAALADRYVIRRELGRGGMAIVFLAEDLKHQRQVAIKVLLPELGAVLGVERFLSEIRVTATLQHPNLLPLFDSGEAGGLLFYVMPFVEGETLRARLDREQQLPVEEAVRFARTMAGALDYAHQRGVIHRDLKPENVMLAAGQPVIADFGIALAVAQAGGQRVTQTGLSLGTPQYMSPEQATGDKVLDARTDLYALGAMTYEMLTGEPPHVGHSAQAIMAKLMTEAVRPLTVLRRSVPPAVDVAVRRALEKLPADRFATAGAFATALGDGTVAGTAVFDEATRAHSFRIIASLTAALIAVTCVAGWALWSGPSGPQRRGSSDARIVRFAVAVDSAGRRALGGASTTRFGRPSTNALAFSPDGSQLVYAAWDSLIDGRYASHLYVRRLGEERVLELAGTDGATDPTFSPDGQWVAFTTPTGVSRTRLDGGEVQLVTPAPQACCVVWGSNDTLVFSDSTQRALLQVAASGGQAAPVPVILAGGRPLQNVLQAARMTGGRWLLFHQRGPGPDSSTVYRLDRTTGTASPLITDAADPKVVAHEFLLFMRRGTLMAVRFDETTATMHGAPVAVVDDVLQSHNMPSLLDDLRIGQYAVSARGDLVYARGGIAIIDPQNLVRLRANGTSDTIALGMPDISSPRVSPNGDRIAFAAALTPRSHVSAIYVYDVQRHVTTKVAEGGILNWRPQWSADGRELAFQSDRDGGVAQVFVVAADGGGATRRVVAATTDLFLQTWSTSGVLAGVDGFAGGDVWTAREGEAPHRFFASSELERTAAFSPDGHWLAYSAAKGGHEEVFVRPYPGPDPAVQISNSGGRAPAWARDGRAVYFETTGSPRALMRVGVSPTASGALAAGLPSTAVPAWPYVQLLTTRNWDLLPNGSFVGVTWAGNLSSAPGAWRRRNQVTAVHVVLDFLSELRTRVH